MSKPIYIYGAGMAGLMAGNMLRRSNPVIHEAAESLPDNHKALLRFRTDKAGLAAGIKFKKVHVQKAIWDGDKLLNEPNIYHQNNYSQKVTKNVRGRSINNLDDCERYIAPDNFIEQLGQDCNIVYDSPLTIERIRQHKRDGDIIISTIPMPALMDMVGWDRKPKFNSLPIWSCEIEILDPICDVYQTVYFPHEGSVYRASVTGNRFICESISDISDLDRQQLLTANIRRLREIFGIKAWTYRDHPVKYQHYGKLNPIDEDIRKEFIFQMTNQFNIYSLGRFATWRQLLIDDIVDDVHVIDRFISKKGGNYARSKHNQS